ncbi:DUF4031 domain-containing protein [uncultured Pseudokineococcus sp.]|uniref:DUF4031 domain-containing protein n=1 Tax=uncultured Pseudokineococcus sp. TaxID=1642928 RepID=UPI002627F75C|nr:DUF4031 domain-containing protein [uncultured Pseudokineococcus sp.]
MAVLVDPPRWPAHGREWSHLVSDVSLDELHAFARRVGIPARGFEGDHYDVPSERLADLQAAGATLVPAGELLRRLVASGLRVPKRRGQQVLGSWVEVRPGGDEVHVDLVVSVEPSPAATTRGVRGLVVDGERRVLLRRPRVGGQGGAGQDGAGQDGAGPAGAGPDRWALPVVGRGRPLGFSRHRPVAAGGRRAPASRWRHIALVAGTPDDVVLADGDEARLVAATDAGRACGAPPWWPLVVHGLEAAALGGGR